MSTGRKRNWCFTLNNYSLEELTVLRGLVDSSNGAIRFVCFQPELGLAGTKHLQGTIIFRDAVTLAGVKRHGLVRGHVEVMRGTVGQSIDYCSKEESRDAEAGFAYEAYGDAPAGAGAGQGNRTDFELVRDHFKGGGDFSAAVEQFPSLAVRYPGGLRLLQANFQQPRAAQTKVFWFYGPTGSGKSRLAFSEYPDAYCKMPGNKWWDGYEQQKSVIIDDYRRDLCTFSELLRLFDRYHHRVEFKGGSVEFNSEVIVITSPKNPQETWEGRSEEDIGQLMRRIHEVRHFSGIVGIPP